MVAADADRIPPRQPLRRKLHRIHHQPQRRLRRKDIFVLRDILLENIVLQSPADFFRRDALLFRHHQIHRPNNRRRAVDGHRGSDLPQGDAVKQGFHIRQRGHRHAALAELPHRPRVIGIVAVQGRQIKGHAQPGLPVIQQKAEPFVGFLGQPKAGKHPHRPQPGTIAAGMNPPQVRKLPRQAHIPPVIGIRQILRRINRLHRQLRQRLIRPLAPADRIRVPFPPKAALFPQLSQFLRRKHGNTSGRRIYLPALAG